jgi:Holliday junction resolvasome RuvABC endonuclease subunit
MIKLFVDQATTKTGLAHLDGNKLYVSNIICKGKSKSFEMAEQIIDHAKFIGASVIVLESVTVRRNSRTAIILAELAGAIKMLAYQEKILVLESSQSKLIKYGKTKEDRMTKVHRIVQEREYDLSKPLRSWIEDEFEAVLHLLES